MMANIIMTESCNLHCPYCFAQEHMAHHKDGMNLEKFKKIVDYITKTDSRVGIIGGEPLAINNIDEYLGAIIDNDKIKTAVVFTNGIYLSEHMKLLSNSKFSVLVNINSMNDMGPNNFEKMKESLDEAFFEYRVRGKIHLGLNIYKTEQNLNDFFRLATRYKVKEVRVSVCCPSSDRVSAKDYYQSLIPVVEEFLSKCIDSEIKPSFDCGKIPPCKITERLLELFLKSKALICHRDSPLSEYVARCKPVVDINSQGEAIRCFGTSDVEKYDIFEYESITELRNVMLYDIDLASTENLDDECKACIHLRSLRCMGGCIAFHKKRLPSQSAYQITG